MRCICVSAAGGCREYSEKSGAWEGSETGGATGGFDPAAHFPAMILCQTGRQAQAIGALSRCEKCLVVMRWMPYQPAIWHLSRLHKACIASVGACAKLLFLAVML